MGLHDADGMQCRPWLDYSSRSSLIWVYIVCSDLSVQNLGTLQYVMRESYYAKIVTVVEQDMW